MFYARGMSDDVRELIIIGGACAGLTAAVYASRANLHPLCIEGFEAGGQLMITSDVENYPGFPEGVLGPDLMVRFREQAERFGTEFITDDVTSVDFSERPFRVSVGSQEHRARAVIVATGASARQLGLPSEQALQARGVSYCATCDAAFFPDKKVLVVGGGDSALEEATYLTKFAKDVVLVHRRDELRGSKIMQDYARAKPNLSVLTPYVVDEVLGAEAGRVTGARLRNTVTGEERVEESDGFFVAIGHTPNTELFRGILDMDENGYLKVEPGTTRTKIEGVFAAGDVADHVYRQAITAAGLGLPGGARRRALADARRPVDVQAASLRGNPPGASRVLFGAMAYFICPNCGLRSMDSDGRDGLTHQAVGCTRCGFGFMFELLDDFYPGPDAGMLACDRDARILAVGKGVFELTGFQEGELIGKDLREALTLHSPAGDDPVSHRARVGRPQARPDARAEAPRRPRQARARRPLPRLRRGRRPARLHRAARERGDVRRLSCTARRPIRARAPRMWDARAPEIGGDSGNCRARTPNG